MTESIWKSKHCPYCAEEIQERAVVCRFCNRALIADASIPKPQNEDRAAVASAAVASALQNAGEAPVVLVIVR